MEDDVVSDVTLLVRIKNVETGEEVEDEFWPDSVGLDNIKKEVAEIIEQEYGYDWKLVGWEQVAE